MKNLFRKVEWKSTIIAAAVAALLFCICVYIFIWWARYDKTWLIYVGSFAFLAVIYYHTWYDSKQRGHRESTVALVFNSHVSTILGVILATAVSFLLLAVFVPGYLGSSDTSYNMSGEPANQVHDSTDGLAFQIILAATVINFSVGSFCGIIVPFTAKRNQIKDAKDPAPLHQGGTR